VAGQPQSAQDLSKPGRLWPDFRHLTRICCIAATAPNAAVDARTIARPHGIETER
jgi:hypothetical protein